MNKIKRTMLSIIMAAAVIPSATSLCANANYTETTNPIDHSDYIKMDFMSDEITDYYINTEHNNEILVEKKLNDKIYFNTIENQNVTLDMINDLFSEFKTEHGDNIQVSNGIYDNDFSTNYKYYVTPYNPEQRNKILKFTANDARRIKELLNNTADKIFYANSVLNPSYGLGELTHFFYSQKFYADMITVNKQGEYERVLEKAKENLNNYLADKNYDITVDTQNDIYVIPNNKDISLEEQLFLLKELYENCGLVISIGFDMSTKEVSNGIDLYNSVDGDANCDEDMNMADAVLIMQSLANPDKYQISEQGEFNSDLNGDGITNADALAVQKKLLML